MGNLLENDIYHFITILTSENATMFIYFIKKNAYYILLITASLYNKVPICYVEAERMASREMLLLALNHQAADRVPIDFGAGGQTGMMTSCGGQADLRTGVDIFDITVPSMVLINGKTYEVKVAQKLAFAPGIVVIVDMAYMDYMLHL